MYQKWFSALKAGYLDHRAWIFDKETISTLINTLKIVRRDNKSLDKNKSQYKIKLRRFLSPPDGIIDFVPWTIKDLYQYHPRGKDLDFWEEFLKEINLRIQNKPSRHMLRRPCRQF